MRLSLKKPTLLHNCHKAVSGKLAKLPEEYKQWKSSLPKYRTAFKFMQNKDTRNACAEQRMFLDYQLSIFLWLKPKFTFKELHFLHLCQTAGFICEAVLHDLLQSQLRTQTQPLARKFFSDTTKRMSFGKLIRLLEPLLAPAHLRYLRDLRLIRDSVHIKNHKSALAAARRRYATEGAGMRVWAKLKRYEANPKKITLELDAFTGECKEYYHSYNSRGKA
jgi:hypothetical protein